MRAASRARKPLVRCVDPHEREARKRRVPELFAIVELVLDEPAHVVARGEDDGRVLRVARLDEDRARTLAAARATRHLDEELETALGRAEIRHGERGVGVDHADQRHVRKIVALRDHLRADEDVDLAGAHPGEHGLRLGPAATSRSSRATRAAGNAAATVVFELLGAEAFEREPERAARRARAGKRAFEIAVVADEPAAVRAVEGERDRAELAADDGAAPVADDARREAASVQKEDGLLAGGERPLDGAVQRKREQRVARGARADAPKVDDLDLGEHGRRVRAIGKDEARELVAANEHLGLERRRGRAEHRDRRRAVRAEDRHVARVVAHALLLLERGVVLFVDDDEAEIAHRREERGARADRDVDLARAQTLSTWRAGPRRRARCGAPRRRRRSGRGSGPRAAA